MKRKITLILMLLISVFANSQEIKYINANELNIRNGAGKNYNIVTTAIKDEKVTIISEQNGWSEIETTNGEKGFVSTKFLSNSISNKEDWKISDYPIASIIAALVLLFIYFKLKKIVNKIFNSSPKKSSSSKRKTNKIINKSKITEQKQRIEKTIEVKKTEIVFCKNCGQQYNNVKQMTSNNCSKSSTGKHQLYEGNQQSKYFCKCCGDEYGSIFQMAQNKCSKSSTGLHQPFEGGIKQKYKCKNCGSSYSSIKQMIINNCSKSPNGKHQPAR